MGKFFLGLFTGLVIATFSPHIADLSRSFFDAGRNLGSEVVETVGEAASE
jgi:hypothetical protein